jgi:hypothetical protein
LSKDATILLVENKDTGEGNSSYYQLNDSQRKFIKTVANKEMPGWDL